MKKEDIGENLKRYTFDELSALPDETDWERFDAMTDEDLANDLDDPPLTEEQLDKFKAALYLKGELVWKEGNGDLETVPVDKEVLEWFKDKGDNYLAQINAVLRTYIETQPGTNETAQHRDMT